MSSRDSARCAPIFFWLFGWSTVLLPACSVQPPSGAFACVDSLDCPDSQRCYNGLCERRSAQNERVDNSVATSGTDAATLVPVLEGAAPDAGMMLADAGMAGGNSAPTLPTAVDAGAMDTATAAGAGDLDTPSGTASTDAAVSTAPGINAASGDCTCSQVDACCDGCRARQEAGSCDSDGLTCTSDVCRAGVCSHEPTQAGCIVDGACYVDGQASPTSPCKYCHAATSTTSWTNRTAGEPCDDGSYCNGGDTCGGGAELGRCAVHSGDPCGGEISCQRCDDAARSCMPTGATTWYDPSSTLTWQRALATMDASWQTAVDTCASLALCGQTDWRLPNIDELRTLVRGCTGTARNGSCRVHEDCASDTCWSADCNSCPQSVTYLPSSLTSSQGITWSATLRTNDTSGAWTVFFPQATIQAKQLTEWGDSRCVRDGR